MWYLILAQVNAQQLLLLIFVYINGGWQSTCQPPLMVLIPSGMFGLG
jgi:hypothetical protein